MNDNERDDDLREWFAAARREDAAWTPSFDRVRTGRSRPSRARPWPWLAATAGVAAVAIAVVVLRPSTSSDDAMAVDALELRSATDFLLDMANSGSPSSVPRIGDVHDWFNLKGLSEDSPS